MNEIRYKRLTNFINKYKNVAFIINFLNGIFTYFVFLSYPLFILYLYIIKYNFNISKALIKVILVPLISFIIISLIRKFINAKRPYEKYNFKPILSKRTIGKSFPSRHIFSVFILATMYLQSDVKLAFAIFLVGILIAIIRVIGGVHFIKDVIFGAIIGLFFGIVGFYII